MSTFADYLADEIHADEALAALDETEGEGEWEDFDCGAVEADAYVLESAGWGTDEDYGFFGGEDW